MAVDFDLRELDGMAVLLLRSPAAAEDAAWEAGKAVGAEIKTRALAALVDADLVDRPWASRKGVAVRSWRHKGSSHVDVFSTIDPEGRPVGFFLEYGTTTRPPVPFLSSQMAWAADAYHEAIIANLKPLDGAS